MMLSQGMRGLQMKVLSGGTSHSSFQALAESRIREARILLKAGELDGAFYLAGYCVECALKAVIAKAIPSKLMLPKGSIEKLYTHDLQKLADFAELGMHLDKASLGVRSSWTVVRGWNEQYRYVTGVDLATAEGLLDSIDHTTDGMLPWLKQHW
jgi:HEPN domain-containing protein